MTAAVSTLWTPEVLVVACPEAIVAVDINLTVAATNPAAAEVLAPPPEIGRVITDWVTGDEIDQLTALCTDQLDEAVITVRGPSGWTPVLARARAANGPATGTVLSLRPCPVEERVETRREIERLIARAGRVGTRPDQLGEIVAGIGTSLGAAAVELHVADERGGPPHRVAGWVDPELPPARHQPASHQAADVLAALGLDGAVRLRSSDGSRVLTTWWRNGTGERTHHLGLLNLLVDVLGVGIHHGDAELPRNDPLTGLTDRAGLESALERMSDDLPDERIAAVVIDLTGTAEVNRRHGHARGDDVVAELARRLRLGTRPDDVVGRLAGDTFALVGPTVGAEEAAALGRVLAARATRPIDLGPGGAVTLSASVGVALVGEAPDASSVISLAASRADRSRPRRSDEGSSPPDQSRVSVGQIGPGSP